MIVTGKLMSKSNSRIIRTYGKRIMLIKKPEAIRYTESAIRQIQGQLDETWEQFLNPVRIDITIWYQTKLPDLDVSLIQDVLEKAGVYKNDRQVYELHAFKRFDKENPRLQVIVTELE